MMNVIAAQSQPAEAKSVSSPCANGVSDRGKLVAGNRRPVKEQLDLSHLNGKRAIAPVISSQPSSAKAEHASTLSESMDVDAPAPADISLARVAPETCDELNLKDLKSISAHFSRLLNLKAFMELARNPLKARQQNGFTREVQTRACVHFKSHDAGNENASAPLCRDCASSSVDDHEAFCRFKNFRVMRCDQNGKPSTDYLDPRQELKEEDVKIWLPIRAKETKKPEESAAKVILQHAGDTFCRIFKEEMKVLADYEKLNREHGSVVFKRLEEPGRETCDVCETTIFNYHWVCPLCGFLACIDCWYEEQDDAGCHLKQIRPWDPCTWNGSAPHDSRSFLLVQNIPGTILEDMNYAMHLTRWRLGIPGGCGCDVERALPPIHPSTADESPVSASKNGPSKSRIIQSEEERGSAKYSKRLKKTSKCKLNLASRVSCDCRKDDARVETCGPQCKHTYKGSTRVWEELDAKDDSESACSFLCSGDLVRLKSRRRGEQDRLKLFQREWRAGQPVLVVGVDEHMNRNLWTPDAFNQKFGKQENEVINSLTGRTLPPQPMKIFWDGFADYKKRLLDDCHRPMLLKLKDWPPGADFKDVLPKWFDDVMKAFPVAPYTARSGNLNLASYLPDKFIPPDLGPKMYVAYGSAIHPTISSTNLHLDVSDAANVMAYVGACSAEDADKWRAYDAAVSAGCDPSVLDDILRDGRRPGALWHIYDAKDSDKIRALLKRVALERNLPLGRRSDPIHDQQTYLDEELRSRLLREYNVVGYSFVQCDGDAVFIPAGAPHQVRNLMNCIKVAEDFVSAETVSHCYDLMKDFRRLSDYHTNHEDKLQIKNMVYHAVKSAVHVFGHMLELREDR